jgi:hypothetical protein
VEKHTDRGWQHQEDDTCRSQRLVHTQRPTYRGGGAAKTSDCQGNGGGFGI